jgi:hypothetical protein
MLEERSLVAPRFTFRIWPVERADGAKLLVNGVELEAPGLAPWASAMAAAACTLGDALEKRVGKLWRSRRRLLALELDAAANDLLFCLSRSALAAIRREARRRGTGIGDALSPGDPGLALDQQAATLWLAGAPEHGIAATGGAMLSPVKSLSFLVPLASGLAPSAGGRCARCPARGRCRTRAN